MTRDDEGETVTVRWGVGNWHAQRGMAMEMLSEDRAGIGSRYLRSQGD